MIQEKSPVTGKKGAVKICKEMTWITKVVSDS